VYQSRKEICAERGKQKTAEFQGKIDKYFPKRKEM
jgi:hypothetical protein